jgi:hypothetical protein
MWKIVQKSIVFVNGIDLEVFKNYSISFNAFEVKMLNRKKILQGLASHMWGRIWNQLQAVQSFRIWIHPSTLIKST